MLAPPKVYSVQPYAGKFYIYMPDRKFYEQYDLNNQMHIRDYPASPNIQNTLGAEDPTPATLPLNIKDPVNKPKTSSGSKAGKQT